MRRWGLVVLALAFAGLGATYIFRGDIALAVLRRAAAENASANLVERLPDGLHAAFCGTGAPLPDRSRAGPCVAIIAGERLFVIDAGEGAAETLTLMGARAGDIEAVLLTHLHSDHIDGLAPLALQHWASAAARTPLRVIGPAGVERVAAGLNEAYAIDSGYRIAHHGEAVVPPSGFGLAAERFTMAEHETRRILVDDGGLRIIAFAVEHAPVQGAVGYRVEYAGRVVVISGDTRRAAAVARETRGADLLIHEALQPRLTTLFGQTARNAGRPGVAQIFADIPDYHTTPEEAAALAEEAGAGALVLTHIVPPLPIPGLEGPFLGDARSRYSGPLWIARDGDVVSLPRAGGLRRSRAGMIR